MQVNDNRVICDLELSIREDVKVPAIANEIQNKVKNALENMTGLEVQEVNLRIVSITKEDAAEV